MSKKTLDEVAYVIDSLHQTPQYQEHGFPMVRIVDINNDFLDLRNCLSVSKEVFLEHNKNHIPQKGDIIITRVGSFGMLSYVNTDEPFCLGQNIAIISPKKNGLFLYYYLKSPYIQNIIHGNSGGSSYKCISLEEIKKLPFCDEGLNSKKIGDLLFLLDSKINCNRKICDELESMAKTLYDYWFTQFDFPDENGKHYRTSGGAMEWNEQLKREIPKGWKRTTLDEVCSFRNGINYDKTIEGNKDYRIINVRNISASTLLINEDELDEICLPSEQADRYLISASDIIIARSGTPGATRLFCSESKNVIFCGFIICATPKMENQKFYLTMVLKSLEGTAATKTGGSILQNVSQDTLKSLNVVIPPEDILSQFNERVSSFIDLIQEKVNENNELIKLRDWLLPMLMNGQATVLDPEPNAKVIAFQNPKPEQYEVRQAARSFGTETPDDTSDLVKEFIKRRNHDAKTQE